MPVYTGKPRYKRLRNARPRFRDPVFDHLMPSITKGLLLNVPMRFNNKILYSADGQTDLSTETVSDKGTRQRWKDGLLEQAIANIARTERAGWRVEGARTNLVYPNRDFSDARWAKTNVSVLTDSIVCPDGSTRTTNTLKADAADATIIQDLGAVGSAAHSGGFWLKRKTGTGKVYVTLDGGTSWTEVTVTGMWTRTKKENQTLADPDIGLKIETQNDEIYADFGQCETAALLSSDIPTTTASVQRALDDLKLDNTGDVHCLPGTGTLICAVTPHFNAADISTRAGVIDTRDNSVNDGFRLGADPVDVWICLVRSGGGTQATLISSTNVPIKDTPHVLAVTWKVNDFRLYTQGELDCTPDTSGAAPTAMDDICVGREVTGPQPGYMNVAHLLIYNDVFSPEAIKVLMEDYRRWMPWLS